MNIIFVRHGDPNYEIDSLTEKGFREAALLAKRVAKWQVTDFYSSPLGRAKDTGRIATEPLGRTMEVLPFMQEFYYLVDDPKELGKKRHPWDFMPSWWTSQEKLFETEGWTLDETMKSGDIKEKFEMVKTGLDEVIARYGYKREGMNYRTEKGSDATIVIFCHLGVQFVALNHLLHIPAPLLWQSAFVAPTSVTVVTTEEREEGIAAFRLRMLGDTSHLYAGNEPASNSGFFEEVYGEFEKNRRFSF
ncbi:MAG: histidine phosphatase family protein [Lachnospiraceae bacterium]|nr:histidine phosphatase family protein [Lachnospiraceae bacterium]